MKPANNHRFFKYNIVLVDDDEDDQFLFATAISDLNLGGHLKVFNSGKEVLRYLRNLTRKSHPSLIVLDYHMPQMNGLELLLQLKASETLSHIPVIVYSSKMNVMTQQKLKACGAIGCYCKSSGREEMKEFLAVLGIVFENSVYA